MKIIIIGGAGFIGTNTAAYFLNKKDQNYEIVIFDNLSRKGTQENLSWLQNNYTLEFEKVDIRNYDLLEKCILKHQDAEVIIHLAAQVAVTTSVKNPRMDFDINLVGTFNLLEVLRTNNLKPLVIYASTNKVYGELTELKIEEKQKRYVIADDKYVNGIDEKYSLDFHSPYGCSKGSADQYIRDYYRIYKIPTVVFRQSCIYGPHQFGIEDQGWVAWFIIATILGKKITIYGNGKQVRDILYVSDLVKAYDIAIKNKEKVQGKIFNIGGGKNNSISLLEFLEILEDVMGKKIDYSFSDWRPGDQKIFISNNRALFENFGWFPQVNYKDGIERIYKWSKENIDVIRQFFE